MTIGTVIYTWLRGAPVGSDEYGNRYYRLRRAQPLVRGGGMASRERRWVLYAGAPEASKVPPEWHAWLHHTSALPPEGRALASSAGLIRPWPWQKTHLPNLTGTALAYHPPGSLLEPGPRASAAGDYEAWIPD